MDITIVRMLARSACVAAMSLLAACASVSGYPPDPANGASDLRGFSSAFGADIIVQYNQADASAKLAIRNQIILERLASYDIVFKSFERSLASQRNTINTGADLVALTLTGLSTTATGAGAKTALSAAATGVIGASGAVNKDLFYQAALPAILTQMEANRALVLADIVRGMGRADDDYPLALALHDLDRYANAGSVPSALSTVTQAAADNKRTADDRVSEFRVLKFESKAPETVSLVSWLYPAGDEKKQPDPDKLKALTDWMTKDTTDPALASMPYYQLLHGTDPKLGADRARAAAALIPNTEDKK